MKKRWLWQWGAVLLMLLALATPVWADDGDSGTVAFGHDLVVKSGDRVRGDAALADLNAACARF